MRKDNNELTTHNKAVHLVWREASFFTRSAAPRAPSLLEVKPNQIRPPKYSLHTYCQLSVCLPVVVIKVK